MPDIGLIWDPTRLRGEWATADQVPTGADDGTSGDLTAAVLVSLLTDGRAPDDYVPTDGSGDRRGCWTDSYEDEGIGSLLWTLARAERTTPTLLAARDACKAALGWLIRDGVATALDVRTFWAGHVAMGILVTVTVAKGPPAVIQTSIPWGAR